MLVYNKVLTAWKYFKIILKTEIKMASSQQQFDAFHYEYSYKKFTFQKKKESLCVQKNPRLTNSAMAAGEISSKFSMLHSSRNSKMGDGWEPTEI